MKLLALFGATAALASAPAPAPLTAGFEAGPVQISARAPDVAEAAIAVVDCEGRLGTVFWTGPTRIVTAAHVTSGARICTIAGARVDVVREDGAADVAELRATIPNPTFLRIDCGGIRRGRGYRAIGFAGGRLRLNLPLLSTGFRVLNGQSEFIGETHPGMSGGPVIDNSNGRPAAVINTRWPASARSLRDTFLCR